MDSKLTLKLDAAAIERGRRYAQRRGISLSRLVEQYFNTVSVGASRAPLGQPRYEGTMVGRLLDAATQWPDATGTSGDDAHSDDAVQDRGPQGLESS